MIAQRHEIGEIGGTLVGPVHHMVDIGEHVVGAAREATPAIAPLHFTALRRRCETLRSAFEHGVAEGVIEGEGHRGVATDPPDGFTAKQAKAFDLGPTGSTLQQREIGVGDNEEARPGG